MAKGPKLSNYKPKSDKILKTLQLPAHLVESYLEYVGKNNLVLWQVNEEMIKLFLINKKIIDGDSNDGGGSSEK
jgi:hypothetical protein